MASSQLINKRRDLILQCIGKQRFPAMPDIVTFVQNRYDDGDIVPDTIEKDIRPLKDLGYSVVYSRREKGYFLEENDIVNNSLGRLMEMHHLLGALQMTTGMESIVQMERQMPRQTDLLPYIISAIKDGRLLEFTYLKYWNGEVSERNIEPYGLKEFKSRWYIVGKNQGEASFKTFSIDRISNLSVSDHTFKKDKKFSLDDFFQYSFGIMNGDGQPIEAILSFSPAQGQYVKSLPLHKTQKILVDNESEVRISLRVWPTFDFIQEVVSYSDYMKVLAPDSLIETVKTWFKDGIEQYE